MTDRVPQGTIVTGEYYEQFPRIKLRPKLRQNRPEILAAAVLILQDTVIYLLSKYGWEMLRHAASIDELSAKRDPAYLTDQFESRIDGHLRPSKVWEGGHLKGGGELY